MTDEEMKAMRGVRSEAIAVPGELKWGRAGTNHVTAITEFITALQRGPDVGIVVVHFDHPKGEDETGAKSVYLAITGNGPNSEANAKFICCAFENWDKLLDEVAELRGAVSEACRIADNLAATYTEHGFVPRLAELRKLADGR